RIDKATFLTANEKRAAVGYGPLDDGSDRVLQKYSPDQPRVPAGQPGGGQWTSGESGSGVGVGDNQSPLLAIDKPIRLARGRPSTSSGRGRVQGIRATASNLPRSQNLTTHHLTPHAPRPRAQIHAPRPRTRRRR